MGKRIGEDNLGVGFTHPVCLLGQDRFQPERLHVRIQFCLELLPCKAVLEYQAYFPSFIGIPTAEQFYGAKGIVKSRAGEPMVEAGRGVEYIDNGYLTGLPMQRRLLSGTDGIGIPEDLGCLPLADNRLARFQRFYLLARDGRPQPKVVRQSRVDHVADEKGLAYRGVAQVKLRGDCSLYHVGKYRHLFGTPESTFRFQCADYVGCYVATASLAAIGLGLAFLQWRKAYVVRPFIIGLVEEGGELVVRHGSVYERQRDNADGDAQYGDEGLHLVPHEVAYGNPQVMENHRHGGWLL